MSDPSLRHGLTQLMERWNEMANFEVDQSNLQSAQAFSQCADELEALLRVPVPEGPPQGHCIWAVDDFDGSYDTSCGHKFQFSVDGPVENGMKYCCYCGLIVGAEGPPQDEDAKTVARVDVPCTSEGIELPHRPTVADSTSVENEERQR